MNSDIRQIDLLSLADIDSESAISLTLGLGFNFKLTDKVSLFTEGRGGIGTPESFKVIYTPMKLGLSFQEE